MDNTNTAHTALSDSQIAAPTGKLAVDLWTPGAQPTQPCITSAHSRRSEEVRQGSAKGGLVQGFESS
eukprot:2760509-Rhodomonas_salina.1